MHPRVGEALQPPRGRRFSSDAPSAIAAVGKKEPPMCSVKVCPTVSLLAACDDLCLLSSRGDVGSEDNAMKGRGDAAKIEDPDPETSEAFEEHSSSTEIDG